MTKRLVVALMVLGFAGTLSAADVAVGTWTLNVAKSKFTAGMEIKENTVTVAEQGANLVISVKGTSGAGKPTSAKYSFQTKGGAVTYTEGAPANGATVAIKRVNANSLDSTSTLNGKEVGSSHTVVSADGKTLTRVSKGMNAQGKAFENTEVYERK